jgi:hypothetical protein
LALKNSRKSRGESEGVKISKKYTIVSYRIVRSLKTRVGGGNRKRRKILVKGEENITTTTPPSVTTNNKL